MIWKDHDVHAVRRIVGIVNYLSKFLQNLSDLCEPLRQLTRKDTERLLTQLHDDAFQKLKDAVSSAPVLRYYVSAAV